MKKTRILGITAATLLTLGMLTGCATSPDGASVYKGAESGEQTTPTTHYTFYQQLPGNKRVLCVWAKSGDGGGLSCDFDHVERAIGDSSTESGYVPITPVPEETTSP